MSKYINELYLELRNKVLSSGFGKVSYEAISLIIAEYEAYKAALSQQDVIQFGAGTRVVHGGTYDGRPAVFISAPNYNGVVGESAEKEAIPTDVLSPGDTVLTFPSPRHAQAVLDALFDDYPQPQKVDGPEHEDGEWAKGWAERSGQKAEPVARWLIEEKTPSGAICWECVEHEFHARQVAAKNKHPSTVSPLYRGTPKPAPLPQPVASPMTVGDVAALAKQVFEMPDPWVEARDRPWMDQLCRFASLVLQSQPVAPVPQSVEEFIETSASYSVPGYGFTDVLIEGNDIRKFMAGKAIVPVDSIVSATREVSLDYSTGLHSPFIIVRFATEDYVSRDSFHDSLSLMTPVPTLSASQEGV